VTIDCNNPNDISFIANGLNLRAWEWGSQSKTTVLALHGWLDNCASFVELSKFLPNIRLIAIDAAGQGKSDHRSEDSTYNIWQDVGEILQVIDQPGLQKVALIGHSRGAVISTLLAGAFPDRVSHLMLIDGLIAMPMTEQDAPRQLASAISDNLVFKKRARRSYKSLESLTESRLKGSVELSKEAAMLIAKRGFNTDSKGYHWSFDQRLRGASELKLTLQQSKAFLAAITAKTELYLASTGLPEMRAMIKSLAKEFQQIKLTEFKGGHHLHMENPAALIAKKIIACLAV
jgi:pimeloyl-ACP methyl ester carboxylesterase